MSIDLFIDQQMYMPSCLSIELPSFPIYGWAWLSSGATPRTKSWVWCCEVRYSTVGA